MVVALFYSKVKKGRFLEKLTVAVLVKFPTFNYNVTLHIVFNNI